ncbi:gamma-glutamyltranspeptidase / glutathione hydrolase / leukotriene-C4 hydrolase [Nematocida sp. AWRm77]|nr:gamma-glutamyltranspeptidase / glutathione hydrolase / leukotriene-C4 hydrolase [Nematocida sp. AWRm77]
MRLKEGRNRLLWGCLCALARSVLGYRDYAITSDLDVASQVGAHVIEQGGNPVDAAVATAVCVGAVNAFASGIGGGGFSLIRDANGHMHGYNFRETAPSYAHRRYYKTQKDSLRGRRAIGIPGEIKGLWIMHANHGKLPWASLFAETIEMMEHGFSVGPVLAWKLREFQDVILADKGLSEIYARNGKVVGEHAVITRKNLARTLRKISADPNTFYSGEVSRSLVSFINQEGTYVSSEDFLQYTAVKTEPLVYANGSLTVCTLGLPTCGYMSVAAIIVLSMVPDLSTRLSEKDFQTVLSALYKELYKVRSVLEDKQSEDLNRQALSEEVLNPPFFNRLLKIVKRTIKESKERPEGMSKEMPEGMSGEVYDNPTPTSTHTPTSTLPLPSNTPPLPPFKVLADHGTTHVNVVGPDGTMVSLTSTINNYWGSGLMDPDTGVILNDQMDDFLFEYKNLSGLSILPKKGRPSLDQFKNMISAYKRPLSSATPIIVQNNGTFYITGGSGGIRIPTSVISTLSRAIFQARPISEAVDMPRLHLQDPQHVYVESQYDPASVPDGYTVIEDTPHKIHSCVHIIAAGRINTSAPYYASVQCPPALDLPHFSDIATATDKRKQGSSAGR